MTAYAFTELLPWLESHGVLDMNRPIEWYPGTGGVLHASTGCFPHHNVSSTSTMCLSPREMHRSGRKFCTELGCLPVGCGAGDAATVRVLADVRATLAAMSYRSLREHHWRTARAHRTLNSAFLAWEAKHDLERLEERCTFEGRDLRGHPAIASVLGSFRETELAFEVTEEVLRDALYRIAATHQLATKEEFNELRPEGAYQVRHEGTTDTTYTDLSSWVRNQFCWGIQDGLSPEAARERVHTLLEEADLRCVYLATGLTQLTRPQLLTHVESMTGWLLETYQKVVAKDSPWVLPTCRIDESGRGGPLEVFCLRSNIYPKGNLRGAVIVPRYVYAHLYKGLASGHRSEGAPAPEGLNVEMLETAFALMESVDRDCDLNTFPEALRTASML